MHYILEALDLNAHLFRVSFSLAPSTSQRRLSMPVWIPGSYLVREFSRHVQQFEVRAGSTLVPHEQSSKNEWTVPASRRALTVSYLVYAHDASVRSAWLDEDRGFFNASSLFVYEAERRDQAVTLELKKPADSRCKRWAVATTLEPVKLNAAGFGRYRAANYDELLDKPVTMGKLQRYSFKAHGTPHEIVLTGIDAEHFNPKRLVEDTKRICEAEIALFEPTRPKAPFKRYCFMLHCTAAGYGGLEHRDSTALIAPRADLPSAGDLRADGYVRLLGLISHEYFHSWNVKRILPRAFEPYDLQQENYTRLLWVFEGFTSYYDDLLLLRAGLIDEARFFKLISVMMSRVLDTPGRAIESVVESSFNAWIKLYRPDENTSNSTVSYYPKGAMVALALDLMLRAQTELTLDDFMRFLWQRYKDKSAGIGEGEFCELFKDFSGLDIGRFYAQHVAGTRELPLTESFKALGLEFLSVPHALPDLGLRTEVAGGQVKCALVKTGGAAQAAGLAAGDVLVALDQEQITEQGWESMAARLTVGRAVTLHFFRDQLLRSTQLSAAKPGIKEWRLWRDSGVKRLDSWPAA